MKAIVMTYDKYRALTDHMIFKYEQLWPDHPFQFRVPYQDLPPTMTSDKVEYKKTSSRIKSTVLELLDDLDDEELIYWCIDDRYPVRINVPRIEQIRQWLAEEEASAISGILFCRCRAMWTDERLTGQAISDHWKNVYLERNGYDQIWIHQFLRVKVLRYLFKSFPDVIPHARSMDKLKKNIAKPASHRIFVSRQNLAVFGESADRGIVTRSCYKSLLKNNLAVPEWCSQVTDGIVMGTLADNTKRRFRNFRARLTRRPF